MIAGYAGETRAEFKESLNFVIANRDLIPKIEQINPFTYYDGTKADKNADYRINPAGLARMHTLTRTLKEHGFRYTKAYIGNLVQT